MKLGFLYPHLRQSSNQEVMMLGSGCQQWLVGGGGRGQRNTSYTLTGALVQNMSSPLSGPDSIDHTSGGLQYIMTV